MEVKKKLSKYCSFYMDGPFSKFYPIEKKKKKKKKNPRFIFQESLLLPQLDMKIISKLPAGIKVLRSKEPQRDRPPKSLTDKHTMERHITGESSTTRAKSTAENS